MGIKITRDEWIVEVDENDKLVDRIDREVAHGLSNLRIHREAMVLIYTNSLHTEFLLQQRSQNKKQFPGLWTLSATGHVDFDDVSKEDVDGYLTAAKRESKEEIGVDLLKSKLVGKIIHKNTQNWAYMGIIVGEYNGKLRLNTHEVSEIKIFNKDTIKYVSDKLTPGAKQCLLYLGVINK